MKMVQFIAAVVVTLLFAAAAYANPVTVYPVYQWTPNNLSGQQLLGRPLIAGKYLYATNLDANYHHTLTVFDITNPAAPSQVGSLPSVGGNVVAFGHYLFVGGLVDRLAVVDVANPAAPVLVNQTTEAVQALAISGNLLFATFSGSYDAPPALKVYDFSLATSPVLVATLALPEAPTDLAVSGQYVLLTNQSGTLRIYDVSNPISPVLASTTTFSTAADGVAVSGTFAYVATHDYGCDDNGDCGAAQGNLNVVDIASPSCPKLVSSVVTHQGAAHLAVAGGYAYIAEESTGMSDWQNSTSVVNITNPAAPQLVAYASTPFVSDVVVSANNFFTAGRSLAVFNAFGTPPVQACTQ